MSNGNSTLPCPQATGTSECLTIQVIEPDPTLPTGTFPPPGFDPAITESGDVLLATNDPTNTVVSVVFQTPKAGAYRFEYLYIDANPSGVSGFNAAAIQIVPVAQSIYGFTVDLAGYAIQDGYIMHWRVVVTSFLNIVGSLVDSPESLRIQLPMVNEFTANFVNPRSDTTYGFTELRVENLTDAFNTQSPIQVQVVAKTTTNFTVAIYPVPPDNNYFLVARTP